MEHVAIVERQNLTWYMHIPELRLATAIDDPSDASGVASRLLAEAVGLVPGEVRVAVHLVGPSEMLVSTASSPVTARHFDGVWHAGQRRGWVRQADASWRALVCYVVDGVQWERTLGMGQFWTLAGDGQPLWPLSPASGRTAEGVDAVVP